MKKQLACLCYFYCITLGLWGQDIDNPTLNPNLITEICYTEAISTDAEISELTDLESLTISDLNILKSKSYENYVYTGLDINNNYFLESSLISHENWFPSWYKPPYKVTTTSEGTTSYFLPNNDLLPDGWTGGSLSETESGTYIYDHITDTYSFKVPFSIMAQEKYSEKNTTINDNSITIHYSYWIPGTEELKVFSNNGYNVNAEGQFIRVYNNDVSLFWDSGRKIFGEIYIQNSDTISETIHHYKFSNDIGYDLLSLSVTKTKITLQNGDCSTIQEIKEYDNWSTNCESLDPRSDVNPVGNLELDVFPNPTSDIINLKIPANHNNGSLIITDVIGNILLMRKIRSTQGTEQINIETLPSGIYIANYNTENQKLFTSKFIKQ